MDKSDLPRYQATLRKEGKSKRTIFNRYNNVCAFLIWLGCDLDELAVVRPTYDETIPEIYSLTDTKAFFKSIEDGELRVYVAYELMLKCGLRDQEAMHLAWKSVKWETGQVKIENNDLFGFEPKERYQRTVPIEDALIARLRALRDQNPKSRLVCGTCNDLPDGHLLRTLKRAVWNAGLACKDCAPCQEHRECEDWYLHKFRATYITRMLRGGVDPRTLMKFSGHVDLATLMRYLAPAGEETVRAAVNSVQWM